MAKGMNTGGEDPFGIVLRPEKGKCCAGKGGGEREEKCTTRVPRYQCVTAMKTYSLVLAPKVQRRPDNGSNKKNRHVRSSKLGVQRGEKVVSDHH